MFEEDGARKFKKCFAGPPAISASSRQSTEMEHWQEQPKHMI
jgi:hypothetical protein